jgi:hypothetical protein
MWPGPNDFEALAAEHSGEEGFFGSFGLDRTFTGLMALATLCLRDITEHLFYMGATSGPGRALTNLAVHSSTHTP